MNLQRTVNSVLTVCLSPGDHPKLARGPFAFSLDKGLRHDPMLWRHEAHVAEVVREFKPDIIHVVSPGDVSEIGVYMAKKMKLPTADKPLTNDPMEATYIGINMWKQAVEKAGTTDVDKVIPLVGGQEFMAPSGFKVEMDPKNHHLHKPVFIGEVKADGQFNVVLKTPGPIKAQPWSPFIPGNDKKKDEPDM